MNEYTIKPLTAKEEALYREGLRALPEPVGDEVLPLHEITRREWMHRCVRLLATLDAARAEGRSLEGYWERAYWRVVPELQRALESHR